MKSVFSLKNQSSSWCSMVSSRIEFMVGRAASSSRSLGPIYIVAGMMFALLSHLASPAAAQGLAQKIDPKRLAETAEMTFSDEFSELSLWDGAKGTWDSAYWWAPPKGATLVNNGEEQWYINHAFSGTSGIRPWSVTNGMLNLEAALAPPSAKPYLGDYKYTSGMLTTYRSFAQTYGYFEMRAKLPAGKGLWPAFWLLPIDRSWPPELDIMEVLGHDPKTLVVTAHSDGPSGRVKSDLALKVADMSTDYHTFGADWQRDTIVWYFDGVEIFRAPTPPSMNKPMYVLLNLAVGGGWPGSPDKNTKFPARYEVDYVRVYKAKGSP